MNAKALFSVIVSLFRRDTSNSILSDKIIQNLAFLVTTIPDLTPNLFAFFVMEIAFLLTHQVQNDISLRFSDRFSSLTAKAAIASLHPCHLISSSLFHNESTLNRVNAFASLRSMFLLFLFCHWYKGILMCGTTSLTRKHRNHNLTRP